MSDRDFPITEVSPAIVPAYAMAAALSEAVQQGVLTEEQKLVIVRRADQFIIALLQGKILEKLDDGTWHLRDNENASTPLVVGGDL